MTEQHDREQVFKLVDYLTKRLDDTLTHSQVSTRNIYFVNGAILAGIYFMFGQDYSTPWSFGIAAALSFLLAVVNWFHANFLSDQNDWYKTLDAEVQRLFQYLDGGKRIWPERLDEARERTAPPREWPYRLVFPRWLSKSHRTYVGIHVALTVGLLAACLIFTAAAVGWI